jgi:nitrite reductase/ring-hydroxylating ferredoxin subunit
MTAATRASARATDEYLRVGTLEDLQARGSIVIRGRRCPLLVVYHDGQVRALDNRCPHLGFPLHKGSIQDGILTCHWHHARFDLASGCTFDLWADDVPVAEVRIEGSEVWVAAECRPKPDPAAHWRRRLQDGLAHNLGLVVAKAVLGARSAGLDDAVLVRDAALFGARMRDGFGIGMTVLSALANVLPELPDDERYLALFQGIRRVGADCAGQAPRRDREPLYGPAAPLPTLERWFRQWIEVRHRDAAERTLLTVIAQESDLGALADLMLAAATDRPFADGGHALDFVNKAFECVDLIGREHAAAIVPTVVEQLASARGADERNAWRHPIDLVALMNAAFAELPGAIGEGAGRRFAACAALADQLLGDEPEAINAGLLTALRVGATPADLGRALAYAAALRIARFGTANEFADWDAALHVFTYANAVHQLLERVGDRHGHGRGFPPGLRGVFHGAMALYLTRYLNQPPARLPGERGDSLDDLPEQPEELCARLLDAFDRQQQVSPSARLVARYLELGHPAERLIATLGHALLREDADFHTYQMFEAGIRQYRQWGATPEGQNVLIALTRYLAAHAPTERARFQTASIARRLHRGERVHETAEAPETIAGS